MNERNDEKLRELLKREIAPMADVELKRDLWPQMVRKLDQQLTKVSGFDWALVALLALGFFFFPEVILGLLYHL